MVIALYSIILVLSLLLPIGYYPFLKRGRGESWLLLLFLSVSVVNLGYLLLSVARSVGFALFANKVAYFGQVFVPLSMLMLISKLSGFKTPRWVTGVLIALAMLMFSLVLTTGHTDWYYSSVELTVVNGAAKLVKEYGPLHPVNLIYVLLYFLAMALVICFSRIRGKGRSLKLACLMLAVVFVNVGGWVVEKLIKWNFEFLSVSYLMSELVFFFVYWLLEDYVSKEELPANADAHGRMSVIFVDSEDRREKVERIVASLPDGTVLTPRQIDVLEGILAGRSRKEIAFDLHLSENTVKMHTRALFKALGVSTREEIIALIGD